MGTIYASMFSLDHRLLKEILQKNGYKEKTCIHTRELFLYLSNYQKIWASSLPCHAEDENLMCIGQKMGLLQKIEKYTKQTFSNPS